MRYLLPILLFAASAIAGGLGKPEPARPVPWGIFNHAALVRGRTIYVIGGWRRPFVFYATVDDDGNVGEWRRTGDFAERMACNYMNAVALGDYLYVMGGHWENPEGGNEPRIDRVHYAPFLADGSVGEWTETTPLPDGRNSGVAMADRGRVYFFAGQYQRLVWYAEQQADGSLGAWQETHNLKSPRGLTAAVRYGDYLFILGGMVVYDRNSKHVFRTEFLEEGGVAKWRRSEPLPVAMHAHAACIAGRDVFVFGGSADRAAVFATRVGDDMHLEDWRRLDDLPIMVTSAQAVTVGDYVFLIGGIRTGEERNHVYNDVWRFRHLTDNDTEPGE